MTTDLERIWQNKSDDDVIEAAGQLNDYTAEGQRVIRSELKRRGLEDPVEQAGEFGCEPGTDAPPRECTACHGDLKYVGVKGIKGQMEGPPELFRIFEDQAIDVYVCQQCGHVDFFLSLAVEEEERS